MGTALGPADLADGQLSCSRLQPYTCADANDAEPTGEGGQVLAASAFQWDEPLAMQPTEARQLSASGSNVCEEEHSQPQGPRTLMPRASSCSTQAYELQLQEARSGTSQLGCLKAGIWRTKLGRSIMQTISRAAMQTAAAPQENSAAVAALQQVQQRLEEVTQLQQRVRELERKVSNQSPLDGLTLGAVEARISILEDDYVERQITGEVCRLQSIKNIRHAEFTTMLP